MGPNDFFFIFLVFCRSSLPTAQLKNIDELSGHSFKVGDAVDLLTKGVPLERTTLRDGRKSENTAFRCLRNWNDSDFLLVDKNYQRRTLSPWPLPPTVRKIYLK